MRSIRSLLGSLAPPRPAATRGPWRGRAGTGVLRYALIGAGSAARAHVREIAGRDDVALVGIADPAASGSWRIGDEHAAVQRFRDAAELLSETRPELVSICTPNRFHCELA